mgnify:CR=1 FL=1
MTFRIDGRPVYALVVEPRGTVHLDRYERVCSRECISRAIEQDRRRALAWEKVLQRARDEWEEIKGQPNLRPVEPHLFAMVSFTVRVTSHAEITRREQERATLQFLRGGKG